MVFEVLGEHQLQGHPQPRDPRASAFRCGLAYPLSDGDGRGRAGALQARET